MVKQEFEYFFSFNQEQVIKFAESTGDYNPIHLDDEFASKSIFKQKIIHGFLSGSVFSKIFGTIYPGNGTLYLKQSMVFFAPMYTNKDYKATLTLIDQIKQKKRGVYRTDIIDSEGKVVFTGEAVVVHDIFA